MLLLLAGNSQLVRQAIGSRESGCGVHQAGREGSNKAILGSKELTT